jgi:hypothetical protein
VEIKCQLDATDEFLLQILLLAQHVSGHHYAHHQELENIIQVVAVCRIWCCKDGKIKFVRFAVVQFPVLSVVCYVRLLCVCVCGLGIRVSGFTFSIFTAPNTTDSNHLYNTLELLMMGIMVPRNMLNKQ